LQLDLVSGPDISTLDIQAWIYETKAPVVLLRCIDGTDDWQFDQLVGDLRDSRSVSRPGFLHSPSHFLQYAIVRWKNQGQTLERLLLAPVGEVLLCAAFPDDGIPRRPTHHPSRPLRVLKHGGSRNKNRFPPGPQASHGNINAP
jgi:hypothetical protein